MFARLTLAGFGLIGWLFTFPAAADTIPSPFPHSQLKAYAEKGDWSVLTREKTPKLHDNYVEESKGTGGATGAIEYSFTASNGKAANYKAVIPADIGANKSYGMLVYLHGDGGADYTWLWNTIVTVAQKNHLIPVAVMSPTANENGPSWWWDADNNAVFLDEVLNSQLLARYNIKQSQVIFSGASGGPTFMNGPWLRHFASNYRGGAVLFCSGLVTTAYSFVGSEDFKRNFLMYYYSGTEDFLLTGAYQAIAYYQSNGMTVRADFPAGEGHCTYSAYIDQLLDARVESILSQSDRMAAN
jgi:hypothetical protein